jgi:hypothetical protein
MHPDPADRDILGPVRRITRSDRNPEPRADASLSSLFTKNIAKESQFDPFSNSADSESNYQTLHMTIKK